MRRALPLVCLLLAPLPALAGAPAADLQGLLDRLAGPAPAPEGRVRVLAALDRDAGSGPALVVTLVPEGAARLVGDPGITLVPVSRPGITWSAASVEHVEPLPYLTEPPTLRLAFSAEDGTPVQARIDYAWCLVDHLCLFGEAEVEVATRAPGG